jgi:hypothetical protein
MELKIKPDTSETMLAIPMSVASAMAVTTTTSEYLHSAWLRTVALLDDCDEEGVSLLGDILHEMEMKLNAVYVELSKVHAQCNDRATANDALRKASFEELCSGIMGKIDTDMTMQEILRSLDIGKSPIAGDVIEGQAVPSEPKTVRMDEDTTEEVTTEEVPTKEPVATC